MSVTESSKQSAAEPPAGPTADGGAAASPGRAAAPGTIDRVVFGVTGALALAW